MELRNSSNFTLILWTSLVFLLGPTMISFNEQKSCPAISTVLLWIWVQGLSHSNLSHEPLHFFDCEVVYWRNVPHAKQILAFWRKYQPIAELAISIQYIVRPYFEDIYTTVNRKKKVVLFMCLK